MEEKMWTTNEIMECIFDFGIKSDDIIAAF